MVKIDLAGTRQVIIFLEEKRIVVLTLLVFGIVRFCGQFNLGVPFSRQCAPGSLGSVSPDACAPEASVRLSMHCKFGRRGDAQPIGLCEY